MWKCSLCENEFEDPDNWTEEDRIKEALEKYDYFDLDDMELICDDCYNMIRQVPVINTPSRVKHIRKQKIQKLK